MLKIHPINRPSKVSKHTKRTSLDTIAVVSKNMKNVNLSIKNILSQSSPEFQKQKHGEGDYRTREKGHKNENY